MRIIFALFFSVSFLSPLQAVAGNSSASQTLQREYEALKVKVDAKMQELADLEKRCMNPQDTCALKLEDIKATLKDLKNQVKAKAKALGVKEVADSTKASSESAAAKAQESALNQAKRQKRRMKLTSLVSAGAGVFLLKTQCNPTGAGGTPSEANGAADSSSSTGTDTAASESSTTADEPGFLSKLKDVVTGGPPGATIGCYLGPLALAQALINHNKAKDLGKVADQMSGSSTESPSGDGKDTSAEDSDIPKVEGTPIAEIPFPCPGKSKASCTLNPNGTEIQPLNGGPPINVGALAGIIPKGTETQKVIDEALENQKELLEEVKQLDPDFTPFAGRSLSGSGGPISPGGSTGSLNSAAGGEEEIEWVDEEEEPSSGNALYEHFTGGAVSAAAGGDLSGDDYESAEEDELDVDAEVQKLLNKYGKKQKVAVKAKKPLSFGKNDKISRANENIFSVIKKRYQSLRKRGEFIEGSPPRRPVKRKRQEQRR